MGKILLTGKTARQTEQNVFQTNVFISVCGKEMLNIFLEQEILQHSGTVYIDQAPVRTQAKKMQADSFFIEFFVPAFQRIIELLGRGKRISKEAAQL